MAAAEGDKSQVRISLTTRHPDIALPEDTGAILVSTGLRRYALSTLVNNLLESEKPVPFDFLINGQFLRTSIDEFLTANGISAETTLSVEYTRALIPPLHLASFKHDATVSSVDVLSRAAPAGLQANIGPGQERILSGTYDGLLRVWNMSAQVLATSAPVESTRVQKVKDAKWLGTSRVVSGGLDGVVRVWSYTEPESLGDAGALTQKLELYGHKNFVEKIAVHAPTSRILSASADTTIGLWSADKSQAPAAPEALISTPNKRRKTSSSTTKPPAQRGPLSLLTGHADPATAVIFNPKDHTVAYSVSRDHTLKTWDLTTSACVDTRTTAQPLMSVAAMDKINLVATGTSARHITLIDPRASATSTAAMTLRGHMNWVVSLATDPESEYGLVSGSYDGSCRIWDVRSVRPGATGELGGGQVGESVYAFGRESNGGKVNSGAAGEGVGVFSVCWDREVGIVSGGQDKMVQINRGQGVVPSKS